MHISPAQVLTVTLRPARGVGELFTEHAALVESLARIRLVVDPRATRPKSSALAVVGGTEIYVDLAGIVDVAAERQRLEKEIRKADESIAFLRAKLARPEFVERAPAEIVERERVRLAEQETLRAKLTASLGWLDDDAR
jgi:valyl-tRNA synthetase